MPTDASEAEIAQWRETHDAWRLQSDAWRRQQQDAERAAREQARREREAEGAAFAAEADERRRVRRATKPRTSFVFVVATLGAAAVAGAVATIVALSSPGSAPLASAIGLLVAAVVARDRDGRRRVRATPLAASSPRSRSSCSCSGMLTALGIGGIAVGPMQFGTSTAPQRGVQLIGETTISVSPLGDDTARAGDITIRKGIGNTDISVYPGTTLELDATIVAGNVTWTRWDMSSGEYIGSGVVSPHDSDDGAAWSWSVHNPAPDADGTTRQQIALAQSGEGSVSIQIYEP